MVLGLIAIAMSGMSSAALADWTAKGELGGSMASGNSDNEALNASLEVKNTVGKWKNTFGFAGNYGNDGTATTAERWEVRGQTQYEITSRAYGFGAARYDDDRFSAYDYQASLSGGLGYKFIDNDRTKLWAQGGPGYRFAEFRDTGESEDGMIFRGDVGLDHQLTESTKIVDRFLVETGSDNTYLQNDIGLEVSINGSLALRVGYQVRHNTDVPPGIDKTDTLTTIGLIYERK
jgi:putative salt-induced outer membrane protein